MAHEAQHAIEAGEPSLIPGLVHNDLSKITPFILQQAARQNDALARKLSSGGSNADTVSNAVAPTGGPRMPTLTGLG